MLNSILQCLLMIVSLTVFCYCLTVYISTDKQVKLFSNTYIKNKYVRIIDKYDTEGNETFMEFISRKDSLGKMKNMYESLVNDNNLEYLEVDKQSILYIGTYSNPTEFVTGKDEKLVNRLFKDKNGKDIILTPLNGMQLGKEASSILGINDKVIKGEYFKEEDYSFDNSSKEVNVILGNKYKDLYEIGDKFKGVFLNEPLTFKVKGILCENVTTLINYQTCELDNYIITPLFDCKYNPDNESEKQFQSILYSIKSQGYVQYSTNDNYEITVKQIEKLARENQLKYSYTPNNIQGFTKDSAISALQTSKVMFIFSIMVMIIMTAVIIFMTIKYIDTNLKYYAIHMMNGARILNIKGRIYTVLIAQWISAIIASFYCCNKYFYNTVYYIYFNKYLLVQISLIVIFIIAILFLLEIYINKLNICLAIRRKD